MKWLLTLGLLGLWACGSEPVAPTCIEQQTRWIARFEEWTTVCWLADETVISGDTIYAYLCVTWPPDAPEWMYGFSGPQERGLLQEVSVCSDLPITETP